MSTLSILKQARTLLGDTNLADLWKEDWEINDAITVAVAQTEIIYPQGYEVTVSGEETIDPVPDDTSKLLFAYKTAIVIREGDEAKVTREGIYVKDGDTTIDTTKGSGSSIKSLSELRSIYMDLIDSLYTQNVSIGGYRVDVYDFEIL